MSTISATGGAGRAWPDPGSSRASAMKDRMFAKADTDGSGTVDKTELQGMLDHIAEKTGQSLGTADDLFSKMDTDGDGSLSKDELAAGMKSLMPAPSSTVAFAQQRHGGHGGHDAAGGPPPCEGAASGSGTATSTDPLDTNGDGTVSAQERAAGEMKDVLKNLLSAMDSDGDKKISASEAKTFEGNVEKAMASIQDSSASSGSSDASTSSSGSGSDTLNLATFAAEVLKQYTLSAANSAQGSTLSLAA